MADSIRNRIINELKTTLETIPSIVSVRLWRASGFQPAATPELYIFAHDETYSYNRSDAATGLVKKKLTLTLSTVLESYETESDDIDAILRDVENKLQEDTSRGQLAVDTEFISNSTYGSDETEPYVGFFLTITVHYRTDVLDSEIAA